MKKILSIIVLAMCLACSSSNDDPATPNDPVNTSPTSSSYIAPPNNQTCTGTIVSQTHIQVNFQWEAFQDEEDSFLTYTLSVINQSSNTETINETLTGTNINVVLEKGITYSWTVSATDSDGASVTGATWQFQTPFDAASNYAPFPATMISPSNGEVLTDNNVTLTWEGNDPDDGETAQLVYDIYLGDTNPPALVMSNSADQNFSDALVTGIYFWKIVSKDPNGNTSDSQIRQFQVQ